VAAAEAEAEAAMELTEATLVFAASLSRD